MEISKNKKPKYYRFINKCINRVSGNKPYKDRVNIVYNNLDKFNHKFFKEIMDEKNISLKECQKRTKFTNVAQKIMKNTKSKYNKYLKKYDN